MIPSCAIEEGVWSPVAALTHFNHFPRATKRRKIVNAPVLVLCKHRAGHLTEMSDVYLPSRNSKLYCQLYILTQVTQNICMLIELKQILGYAHGKKTGRSPADYVR